MKPNTGYNGNPLLKKTRSKISWTPDMVQEWIKCSTDPIYFAEKYIKVVHVDRGFIPIKLYDYQREIIDKITNNRRVTVVTSRQAGKALCLNTLIPLADGTWTTMGELTVGEKIIGSNGKPTEVLFKSEIHNKPCYKLEFSESRESVIACEDHLWQVWDRITRRNITIDTKKLANSFKRKNLKGYSEFRYAISNISAIEYPEANLTIDPYILGCWLGDGATNSNTFTCLIEHKQHYEQEGLNFTSLESYERNSSSTVFTSGIEGIRPALRELGLLGNKHIPIAYLTSSKNQRIRLLQGLMDTDGFVEKNGTCHIQLSNKTTPLIEQTYNLLVSLGFKVTTSVFENTNSTRLSYNPSGSGIVPVKILHKLSRIKANTTRERYVRSRSIVGVKLVESVPTQCITVDADDSLFAFSKDYILTHNTTTAAAVILHYILFNDHKTVALLANKGDAAREILDRIKLSFESLPDWLQQGVIVWNKGSIELENGCEVIAAATSSSAIRGKSISLLYIDEAAFVEGWDQFFASVFPTITSGETTKILFTSTPNGLNHFYKTCAGAKDGINGFEYVEVPWNRVPGRGERWRKETLAAMDFDTEKFNQEFNCEFLGSSGTLISGSVLKTLVAKVPIKESHGLYQYEPPYPGNSYVLTADVSRGKGLDYSAFQVINITKMPYQQVCVYKNNMITPVDYSSEIHRISKMYNNAVVLVEINDVGAQVADALHYDFDCENLIYTENAGARGKRISAGSAKSVDRGIRTTKVVKSIGCSMVKLLIEQRQLVINDHNTIYELSRFSKKGSSYEAEPGCNDDLVMGLVLFAWLTDQPYFKELTDIHTLMKLRDKTDEEIESELTPFGFVSDGHPDDDIIDFNENQSPDFAGMFL